MSEAVVPTPHQQEALDLIVSTVESQLASQFVLAGSAGTGKTTLVRSLEQYFHETGRHVKYLGPTGKSTDILSSKLRYSKAETIYSYTKNFITEVVHADGSSDLVFEDKDFEAKILVIDEASMVNQECYDGVVGKCDLIVWIGDPFQLPPIGGDPGIFNHIDFELKEIHRQAEGSPIIQLATRIREGKPFWTPETHATLPVVKGYGHAGVIAREVYEREMDVCLVYNNWMRVAINQEIRKLRGYKELIEPGEQLICLKTAYTGAGQAQYRNGEIMTVVSVNEETKYTLGCELIRPSTGDKFFAWILKDQLNSPRMIRKHRRHERLFAPAYAITGHKSQASQWKKVALVADAASYNSFMKNEDNTNHDWKRWLYTTVTRAEEELLLFE